MPTEMAFDALSRYEQYASLFFMKFKLMDQTILFIRKATFQFRGPFLKTFHTLYAQKYDQHVFKHLVIYVFVLVKTDSDYYTHLKYSYKIIRACLEQRTKKWLVFFTKTSYEKGVKLVAYFECKSMIVMLKERAF